MNILLVYPEFPDSFWSFKHALPFIHKRAAHPPLGLLTVAAMLPHTWTVRLVDANVRELTAEDLSWADCVFVSAMGVQRESALQIIDRCNKRSVRVVAGGSLFTAEPEQFPQVDHLICGEAELTLPNFLEELDHGCAQHVYKATGYANLEASPVPRWDLVNFDDYGTMSVQYSRGCPYDCEFCDITALYGRKPRIKAAHQVIGELDALYDLGWRGSVFFVDDNLIGNKRRMKAELMPALAERHRTRPGFEYNTQASINLADDPELMDM
ncbi:MAG TPA: cobalamin-dependent protein, partial [Polyangiaceae bacterium]